jgi:hypothetical protein
MRTKIASAALEKLKQMHYHRSSLPDYAKVKYRHKPDSTNGITRCIIDYINYSGQGQAERIATSGRWVGGETFVDVIGRKRELKGNWIPGSSTNGSADIAATKQVEVWRKRKGRLYPEIVGVKVAIEVKSKTDRQSEAQKRYQKAVEAAGGVYLIARVGYEGFDEFVKQWEDI